MRGSGDCDTGLTTYLDLTDDFKLLQNPETGDEDESEAKNGEESQGR